MKNVQEMKRLLKICVRNDLFDNHNLPDVRNRRYFPSVSTIRAHMVAARRKMQLSLIDQEALLEKVKIWEQEDASVKIFFRPKSTQVENEKNDVDPKVDDDEIEDNNVEDDEQEIKFEKGESTQSLLFVYQAEWQRRIFQRYGGEMLLLDATYKTTRYVLPLFFLVVKTNVDYQIVGTFIIENETKRSILEALNKFKEWNPSTSPNFCMADYCNEEIEALEETFPGTFFPSFLYSFFSSSF